MSPVAAATAQGKRRSSTPAPVTYDAANGSLGVVSMLWRLPFTGPGASQPPIDPAAQHSFGALQDRFATADAAVVGKFTEYDQIAVAAQASHRRFQFALILGAAVTATLGALQAALEDHSWPGLILGLLGLLTAALVRLQRGSRPLARYLECTGQGRGTPVTLLPLPGRSRRRTR